MCFVSSHAQLGGAEIYLHRLLQALGPAWVAEVLVLGAGPFAGRLRAAGLPVRVVPCGRRAGLVAGALRMRRILLARPPALVHANGVKAALVCVLATLGHRIPVVWHKHDSARDGRLGRLIARRCALVVGVSEAAVASLRGVAGVRVTVVRNGIPPQRVDRIAARRTLRGVIGAPEDAPVVGQVGRLHPGKGQLELVEIIAVLRDRLPGLWAVVVGDPDPYEPAYAQRVRDRVRTLGLEDRVALLGHREDAVDLIAGLDVLAMPSRPDPASGWREGLPLTPLEAMAVGTPVAGYAEPGIVEAVGSCGALVATGDRPALERVLLGVLEDAAERERLRVCGGERIGAYTLDAAAGSMAEAYVSVL